MAEHTKGPWHIHTSNAKTINDSANRAIAMPLAPCGVNEAEWDANSFLIAAAPTLLAAAEAALKNETYARLTGFGNMPDDLFAALTAAIAEARGEKSAGTGGDG